ncbi:MAG: recombination mediator RecR [Arenicellales bacterium]|jgi:recombination protein RecR|nr:recombination protein RecR [Gammaproteobacteria bacterium]MCH1476789.1 recombination mediator RecR [Arenicellales bacterium]MDB4827253.1 recombination mediator RecR [Gammaproteobacteria bacterium]MDC1072278.1 recombination mediator RecR [Gammaproteobacteria bacterium]MDG1192618.1 recombination mediator RecR [Arenicellales bacterium]
MASDQAIENLKDALRRLPGVGPRTAGRMAFHLLERDREGGKVIAEALNAAISSVNHCARCNNFSEEEFCGICSSGKRDRSILCVVETPADLDTIEQAGAYTGYYFVLMGHLSPLDGVGPEQLGFDRLLGVVTKDDVAEVILGTNLTVEGQATADYLYDLLEDKPVKISRLARGVPAGGELEYMDANTLNQAFADRRMLGEKS